MKEDSLTIYLDEIGRTPLLTEEQERQLAERIKKGDERALNKLVEANLRLVVATARTYQDKGMDIDDLISEGNIGLMKAAAKYNPEGRTTRFAGYAVPVIRRQIEKVLDKLNVANPDASGNPHGGVNPNDRAKANVNHRPHLNASLDAPLGIKPNLSLLAVLADSSQPDTDSRLYSNAQLETIEKALRSLNERQARVITAYFGIGQEHATMAEIAADMGLKRERVRQIRNQALRHIRKAIR